MYGVWFRRQGRNKRAAFVCTIGLIVIFLLHDLNTKEHSPSIKISISGHVLYINKTKPTSSEIMTADEPPYVGNAKSSKQNENENCSKHKYIVYKCNKACGSIADVQLRMIAAYLVALLTNRTFVIMPPKRACSIEQFLKPNHYDWLECRYHVKDVMLYSPNVFRWRKRSMKSTFEIYELLENMEKEVIILDINWHVYNAIRYNLTAFSGRHMTWIAYSTTDDIIFHAYHSLFQPVDRVTRLASWFFENYVEKRRIVCAQLGHDLLPGEKRKHVANVKQFLERYSNSSKYAVFVAAKSSLADSFEKLNLPNYLKLPVTERNDYCENIFSNILQYYILTQCNGLLVTSSSTGLMAAFLREEVGGLFRYDGFNNFIRPIDKDNLYDIIE